MDDGGLCGKMVDASPTPPSPPEKPFGLRALGYTLGFLVFILGIVPSLFHLGVEALHSDQLDLSDEIRAFWTSFQDLVGIAIFAAGFAAYLFCSAWLIFHGRGPHVEFDPPKVFVATGPYRWVRNPVVICLLTAVFGEAIYLGSIGILLLVLLGLPLAHLQVTKMEEPRLTKRFGQSYLDYCKRVPRWLPRPPQDRP